MKKLPVETQARREISDIVVTQRYPPEDSKDGLSDAAVSLGSPVYIPYTVLPHWQVHTAQ